MRRSEEWGGCEPPRGSGPRIGDGPRSVCGCVFFFQAEDGIRDYKVTGVQTCALPILRLRHRDPGPRAGGGGAVAARLSRARLVGRRGRRAAPGRVMLDAARIRADFPLLRSGERRGGEEWRARWAPRHLKKKNAIWTVA